MERASPKRGGFAAWSLPALRWKARQEASELKYAPRMDIGLARGRTHGDQVLRGFIQINLLPKPR